MRITSFWAQGYRSLRDVKLEGLGEFNVFYGPNGAGKSNVLDAMRTLFKIAANRFGPNIHMVDLHQPAPMGKGWIEPSASVHDRCNLATSPRLRLGAELTWNAGDQPIARMPWPGAPGLIIELEYEWDTTRFGITCLATPAFDLLQDTRRDYDVAHAKLARAMGLSAQQTDDTLSALRDSIRQIALYAFALISADRSPRPEKVLDTELPASALLERGDLVEGLRRAREDTDVVVRQRYKQLEELLKGEPFCRPPFEIVRERARDSERVRLVEVQPGVSAYDATEVPLDLVGLGVAQIYRIVAQALLSGARSIGIEEPEAHLHAPTTGIQLRQMLERLVREGFIDQLFIATHSNLFDLDPDGYYDVENCGEAGTQITRKPLAEIDRLHLYEPGPAKHVLLGTLRYLDPHTIMFHRGDGQPISVAEMIDMLQRDDPVAVEFLRDVHGAAVRSVRIQHEEQTR